ncbi:MAG: translation initiation factor IF-3 [Bdellovibrionia bacterium]
MAFTPSSPSSPSGPPSFSRPRFPRGPVPNQNKDEHRLNERIRVPQVRLIDEKGNQVGIVPTYEALQMARDRGLDLMEVSPNAQPPVCKICDYGKFKYEKKKKEQLAKKKQTVIKVKEIQLRPQTEEHDLDYKFKSVRQFLEDGDKAKITITFKGREIAFMDEHGFKIMKQLIELVKDVGSVESPPKVEGKKMIMVLAPGASKKPAAGTVQIPSPVSGTKAPTIKPVITPVQPKPGKSS